ncbi:MAG: hypothetical protein WD136_04290 [Cyanobium sp.]
MLGENGDSCRREELLPRGVGERCQDQGLPHHCPTTTARAWACDWARLLAPGAVRLARFYVKNRRDGSRLLSSALVICVAGLVRIDHPIGQAVALLAGLVSLYWWTCYRQLQQ